MLTEEHLIQVISVPGSVIPAKLKSGTSKNMLPCVNSKVSKMMMLSPDSAGRCCRRCCHRGFIDHTKQLLYFQLLMDVRRRKRTLERYYM